MTNIALIVAAGTGYRFIKSNENYNHLPKQYQSIDDEIILAITIKRFISNENIDYIRVVINKDHLELYNKSIININSKKLLRPVYGGDTRQMSVRLGLINLIDYVPNKIIIHDAVRPFISNKLINDVSDQIKPKTCVITGKKIHNTVKRIKDNKSESIDRDDLYSIETPQGFIFDEILSAHEKMINIDFTDDSSLFEYLGKDINIIESDEPNDKITTIKDIRNMNQKTLTGMGFDAHRFSDICEDTIIMLGGVEVEFNRKIIAHSDGDVILHSLVDAIFGAIGCGDIGMHFPPNDDKWKDCNSSEFVTYAYDLLQKRNAKINNIDITLICEEPKLQKYRDLIRDRIANLLYIDRLFVNIKATTTEKMGFLGRIEGIAAQSIITIYLSR